MLENSWRALYEIAVLELDPSKFEACVKEVEHAISAHLASRAGQISREELLALQDASSTLRVLKLDRVRNANSLT
jgi:hypothetical protein